MLVGGCASRVERTLVHPHQLETLDRKAPHLKAHLANGHVFVLEDWAVVGNVLHGTGAELDVHRTELSRGPVQVPVKSILLFETNVKSVSSASAADGRERASLADPPQGMWRLDRVAMVSLGGEVTPVRIAPERVTRDGAEDAEAHRALVEPERTFVTLPGDEARITYRLPPDLENPELFLEARGYYLEWMREEWLREEDRRLAQRMFLDPSGSLRRLAPAFKELEPEMERLFWSSRYVARD